jgi:hypothetical protein
MTDDELNRIDKQFDSLEETLRCGFTRMHSRIEHFGETLTLLGQANARILETRLGGMESNERHAELLAAIREMKG